MEIACILYFVYILAFGPIVAGATVNTIGCGFDYHSRESAALSFVTLQNSVENG